MCWCVSDARYFARVNEWVTSRGGEEVSFIGLATISSVSSVCHVLMFVRSNVTDVVEGSACAGFGRESAYVSRCTVLFCVHK